MAICKEKVHVVPKPVSVCLPIVRIRFNLVLAYDCRVYIQAILAWK